MPTLRIAQDDAADELLGRDPLALLIGMLLDQQFPMERAFGAPRLLADRLGVQTLSAADLAAPTPRSSSASSRVRRRCTAIPARWPAARRTCAGCSSSATTAGPRTSGPMSRTAPTLLRRLGELPGFGAQKSKIFVALLGKQYGVTPPGWREAAGDYGLEGSRRSVADITGPESLAEVRAFKQEQKQAAKAAKRVQRRARASSPDRGGTMGRTGSAGVEPRRPGSEGMDARGLEPAVPAAAPN